MAKGLSKKQAQINKILMALLRGRNLVRNGKFIVNNIGYTTYVSYDDLSGDELIALGKEKKRLEKVM